MPAFQQEQYTEPAEIIREAITRAGTEAGQNLQESQEAFVTATQQLDERTRESKRSLVEMQGIMNNLNAEKESIIQLMQQKNVEMEEVKKVMESFNWEKNAISLELAAKTEQVTSVKKSLERPSGRRTEDSTTRCPPRSAGSTRPCGRPTGSSRNRSGACN